MSDQILLKLGGSVITEKNRTETLDDPTLRSVTKAIGTHYSSSDDLIIVHGGGSFGHHHADNHDVTTTSGSSDYRAAMEIHGAMKTLNTFVLDRLHDQSIPAVPVHPFSVASRSVDGTLDYPVTHIQRLLDEGFVPVTHGDVIAHENQGVTILSGDEIIAHFGRTLEPDRIGLCSTVPGVLDEDDTVIDQITEYESVSSVLGDSSATDVSGGMAAKVKELLSLGHESYIFDPSSIDQFFSAGHPGTRIVSENSE